MSLLGLRRGPLVAAGVVLALGVPLAAAYAQEAGSGGHPVRTSPDQVPVEVTAEARKAPAGTLLASGPGLRVERVRLSRPVRLAAAQAPVAEVPRLTVSGHFQLRDMPLVVVVDGTPVGRAVEAPDLASATVVLPAESLAHDGARVSFRYGPEGPDTAVGTLKAAR